MKRPVGVTVLACFYFLGAILFLAVLIVAVVQPAWVSHLSSSNLQQDIAAATKFKGVHALLVLVFAAFGVGFWLMQRWARWTVMAIMAVDLSRRIIGLGLYQLLRSMDPSRPVRTPGGFFWFAAAINAAMFLYLRMAHVRQAFNKTPA